MANIIETKRYIKGSARLYLKTPLLLKSGYGDMFSDSTIEKTYDGEYIHINGYIWSSLLRRCMARLKEGAPIAERIGKYGKDREGVSPLWCEPTFIPARGLYVRPGLAVDRRYGSASAGALFNDEVTASGLELDLNWNYFLSADEKEAETKRLFLLALRVATSGVENIGGGWSYGFGRIGLKEVYMTSEDLRDDKAREALWRFDRAIFKGNPPIPLPELKEEDVMAPWKTIRVEASILPGQLLAIQSSFPLFDPEEKVFDSEEKEIRGEYPDSFVYKGYIMDEGSGKIRAGYLIPGRSLRQALFSVPIERRLRTMEMDICDGLAGGCKSKEPFCLKCRWFGSTDRGGMIAVTDALIKNENKEIIRRIHLCEHSMQNINLFSSEYLTAGQFGYDILIDTSMDQAYSKGLEDEIIRVLNEMRQNGDAPPGWHRLGATSTATGQVMVLNEPEIKTCGVIYG